MEQAPATNTASKAAVRKARRQQRVTREIIDTRVRRLLDSEDGRWLFREVVASGGLFRTSSLDALTLAFDEGARNIARKFLALVERARPDLVAIIKPEPTGTAPHE